MSAPTIGDLAVDISGDPPLTVRPSGPVAATILFLHWFDEAPNANRTQFLDEATSLADHGVASILPQLRFPWREDPAGLPADLTRIQEESDNLEAILGAADKEGLVVEGNVGLVGHDFGAMHAILLMTRREFKCGVLIAPTPRWSDWFLRFWPIPDDRYDYMRGLHDVDPINLASDTDAPLLFQFGMQDFFIAPMTGSELANAAKEPKTLIAYEAEHDMDISDARIDREAFLLEHLGLDQ